MPRIQRPRLTSRHNPIVARCRAVAGGDEPGRMLIDGGHLVAEALAAGTSIEIVIADADTERIPAALLEALQDAGIEIVSATSAVMAAVSPVRSPSPLVAIADRPAGAAALYRGEPLVMIACDVQDPGNLGAIVRVSEAAGATGLIAAGATADPFGWKALRGSMGSAFRLPIAVEKDLAATVRTARQHGCRIVATVPREGTPLFGAILTGPLAILIGGEGAGLAPGVVEESDLRLTIPMAAAVESLNAAVAAALIVYEARRQRLIPLIACSPPQADGR